MLDHSLSPAPALLPLDRPNALRAMVSASCALVISTVRPMTRKATTGRSKARKIGDRLRFLVIRDGMSEGRSWLSDSHKAFRRTAAEARIVHAMRDCVKLFDGRYVSMTG